MIRITHWSPVCSKLRFETFAVQTQNTIIVGRKRKRTQKLKKKTQTVRLKKKIIPGGDCF
jgi:hypothetical protein